jgi:hypothetical protein
MTNSKAILATTSKEIREHAQAARGQSERDIILAPVDFSDHSEAALIQAAQFVEKLQRIFYFARRMARTVEQDQM